MMYPVGTTLLLAFVFGWEAFISATNLFGKLWQMLIAALIPVALVVLSSVLYVETLFYIAIVYAVLILLIALIKKKIQKG